MRLYFWLYGRRWFGLGGGSFSERIGGTMFEVNLDRLMSAVLYHLRVLAAVRCMCKDHGIEVDWCLEWEAEVGETARELRELIEARGNVLRVP